MLIGSFFTGLSGLQANSFALNVVGNNLANVNTFGFKKAHASFAEIMSSFTKGFNGAQNPIQVGLGVRNSEVISRFTQGAIQDTGIATHMAIQGAGFFMLQDEAGATAFTRSGNFTLDQSGFLVNPEGYKVRGFMANGGVVDTDTITDVRIDLGQTAPASATSLVRYITNLSADAADGDTYASSIEVYDSLGVSHTLSVTFTKTANPLEWTYAMTFDGDATGVDTGGGANTGTLTFNPDGSLADIDGALANPTITIDAATAPSLVANGANSLTVTWDVVDAVSGNIYLSQFGTNNSTGTLYQDGYATGVLQDISVDEDGTIVGFYSNGLSLDLARVAIATFNNNHGLKKIDGTMFLSTGASGPYSIDGEGTGGKGAIVASSLENSNVDIAEEFTSMIIFQRGYQSNSRIITTVDQLMQEAINLKR